MRPFLPLLCLASCSIACGEPAVPDASAPTPAREAGAPARLVPEEEIARMRAEVDTALQANRAKKCLRPVLHGAAVPGNADEDLAALAEATGPLAACKQASPEGLRDSLTTCTAGDDRASGPLVEPCRARSLTDRRSLESHVQDSFEACEPLDDAIARAVSHDDACSPYLPGRRPAPASYRGFVALGRAVQVRARHLAQEGQTAAAMKLALDWVRAGQDLGRGGTSFVPVMIGTSAVQGALSQAEVMIAEGRATPEELTRIATSVDALLAAEPSIAEILAGDHLSGVTTDLLPALDGERPASTSAPIRETPFGADARDDAALAWVAAEAAATAERAACPPTASAKDCVNALERVANEARQAAERATGGTREQALAVLRGVAPDARVGFVKRLAFRRARLGALRVQVEWQRHVAPGRCPSIADLGASPFAALMTPAGLGDALTPRAAEGGSIDLMAPAWIGEVRAWTLPCPPPEED